MAYSHISDHRQMVHDHARNDAYIRALEKVITADSVVLDLGAGLGILGLLAASLGARKVYLVEPQPLVKLATDIAAANNLGDRIEVLQGRIEEVSLPEKVDVIVSVFTGNLLYSEDLLPSLFYARDHFLKPGGHLIPDRAQLWLAPFSCEEVFNKNIGIWSKSSQNLDFSNARKLAANEILWYQQKDLQGTMLGKGSLASEINLMEADAADCDSQLSLESSVAGYCHCLLAWISLHLGDEWLSTATDQAPLHWSNALLPLDPPLELAAGSTLAVKLKRPAFGDWQWQVTTGNQHRAHSTFLSRANSTAFFAKQLPDHTGVLNENGKASLLVLQMIQEGKPNKTIADLLMERFPARFPNAQIASRFVHKLMLSFTEDQ